MSKEDHESGIGKKHNSERNLLVLMLVLGIIIGGLLSMYLVFPEMEKAVLKDNAALKEKNTILEKAADSLVNCMQKKGVNYYQECK